MSTIKLFCFATHIHKLFSVICLKSVLQRDTAVSSQKRQKSVLDTDNPYQVACLHTTTFRVTDSGFCSYKNPSRAIIPLIRPHQCDSKGGRIRGVLL